MWERLEKDQCGCWWNVHADRASLGRGGLDHIDHGGVGGELLDLRGREEWTVTERVKSRTHRYYFPDTVAPHT